mgnify:CR=1 FL=1
MVCCLGYLESNRKHESILSSAYLGQRDLKSGRLLRTPRATSINPRYFVSEVTGESLFISILYL